MLRSRGIGWAAAGVLCAGLVAGVDAQMMRTLHTKYYTLQTDVDDDLAREAALRITLMFEEYQQRTRDFAGRVNRKLPLRLFKSHKDLLTALGGGPPNLVGVFTGDTLMAYAGTGSQKETWHTVQHEGFHQFVHFAMDSRKIPVWANEGLAEYFGEGLFTGDNFYTGVIPPDRLARVRKNLERGAFRSLREMMVVSLDSWNAEARHENYDQAWMMVHFLAHADDGKYQSAFGKFLANVWRSTTWEPVWVQHFGRDVNSFQKRWEEYWKSLPENPTQLIYAQATTATLTSFYARAFSQRQIYEDCGQFFREAADERLRADSLDWLPPALLKEALARAPQIGKWSIDKRPGRRLVVCELADGTQLEGAFRVNNRRVANVSVTVRPPKKAR